MQFQKELCTIIRNKEHASRMMMVFEQSNGAWSD